MTTPRRIFEIYRRLQADAASVRDAQTARGEKVSGTVSLLLSGDAAKVKLRFVQEMDELTGVIAGEHDDPYILEATQTYYWACLYAVMRGATWETLAFDQQREAAAAARFTDIAALRTQYARLTELDPTQVAPSKLFFFWWSADLFYRATTPAGRQWSVTQIMAADLHEMTQRSYLKPILDAVPAYA